MNKPIASKSSFTVTATLLAVSSSFFAAGITFAAIDDDIYEGSVFSLYGNNGALVPPRITLAESIRRRQPALVILYINDSRDCKKQAFDITQLQSRFGSQVNFIAVNVDTFPQDQPDLQTYFQGEVPKLLLFDPRGKLLYESTGYTPARTVEPYFRKLVIALPPRSTPAPLAPALPTQP
jgi:hypothetical protein